MDELMAAKFNGVPVGPELATLRDKASGIALALAIFTNPYQTSVDAIRAEAVERWEARQS
jgi:hypothetical protein